MIPWIQHPASVQSLPIFILTWNRERHVLPERVATIKCHFEIECKQQGVTIRASAGRTQARANPIRFKSFKTT